MGWDGLLLRMVREGLSEKAVFERARLAESWVKTRCGGT